MNYEIKNDIGIFYNAFDDTFCDEVISFYENTTKFNEPFTRQQAENNISQLLKTDTTVQFDPCNSLMFRDCQFMRPLSENLYKCYQKYVEEFPALFELPTHKLSINVRLQKTKIGQGYHVWHCEQGSFVTSTRIAGWSIYLNDVDEGGETEFLRQHIRIPAKKGTACIFPASYTHAHRGNPPISNDKYILTSWIEFMS